MAERNSEYESQASPHRPESRIGTDNESRATIEQSNEFIEDALRELGFVESPVLKKAKPVKL